MEMNLAELLEEVVHQALDLRPPTKEQGLAVLECGDEHVLEVVTAGSRVRRHFFQNRVKLNLIVNMKSGLCPEDCSYCSQRRSSDADVLKYNWIDPIEAAATADRAVARGTKRVCLVASGRGPSDRDVVRVAKSTSEACRVLVSTSPIRFSWGTTSPARAQAGSMDLQMIADAGFVVEGQEERSLPAARRHLVALRRHGPGTAVPANA
jgi:biotin synthase-like enzyme